MNLSDGATFTMALIKRATYRFNKKINVPRDTNQHIIEIETNNGWNTQIVHILREKRDGKFIFKDNLLSRLKKPLELSHKWVNMNPKYQEP